MPVYDLECEKCGKVLLDEFVWNTELANYKCPIENCDGKMSVLMNNNTFIAKLVGFGFHNTEYMGSVKKFVKGRRTSDLTQGDASIARKLNKKHPHLKPIKPVAFI
jgi:predicted nucleic acid-binding Zn ribbon protein